MSAKDFLANDTVGWNAPGHVEAGESGDFYALDQHRDRIVRISSAGRVVREYALPRESRNRARGCCVSMGRCLQERCDRTHTRPSPDTGRPGRAGCRVLI